VYSVSCVENNGMYVHDTQSIGKNVYQVEKECRMTGKGNGISLTGLLLCELHICGRGSWCIL